jgi:hypothetical protein
LLLVRRLQGNSGLPLNWAFPFLFLCCHVIVLVEFCRRFLGITQQCRIYSNFFRAEWTGRMRIAHRTCIRRGQDTIIWCPHVVPAHIWPHRVPYGCHVAATGDDGLCQLMYLYYYPKRNNWSLAPAQAHVGTAKYCKKDKLYGLL